MALPDPGITTSFPENMDLTRMGWGAGVSRIVFAGAAVALVVNVGAHDAGAQSIPTPIHDWKAPIISPLSGEVIGKMVEAGNFPSEPGLCPVTPEDLRLVRVSYRGMDGGIYYGGIVVNRALAEETAAIFTDLYMADFPLNRVSVGFDDARSMALDNTSGFDCGKSRRDDALFSLKNYGMALDLNPRENPYIRPRSGSSMEEFLDFAKDASGSYPTKDAPLSERLGFFCGSSPDKCVVMPPEGVSHLVRDGQGLGEVTRNGPAFRIFSRFGWAWGGDWPQNRREKIRSDYQRFERNPR